jgi:hypothetical protein
MIAKVTRYDPIAVAGGEDGLNERERADATGIKDTQRTSCSR